MWLMAGVVAGLCGGGCYDEDPTGPRRLAAPVAQVLVTADTACVRARFDLTGPTTVLTQVPERSDCATSLVLIRAQPAEWAQNPHRKLRFFVRILNTSGAAIQLPVRLYLPATGTTVEVPAGTPASKVVPLNADSTDAGGGKIWFLGGTSVLGVGDSTVLDTLGFNVQSPVDQARWQFQATAGVVDSSPPAVPKSIAWPVNAPPTLLSPSDSGFRYYRNVFGLAFDPGVSGTTVMSFLGEYAASIIGGLGANTESPMYIIQVPDPGATWTLVDSLVAQMAGEAGVARVVKLTVGETPQTRGRYPRDASYASQRSSWFAPSNVAVRPYLAIRAPLAWGCETGKYQGGMRVRVAVWDSYFDAVPLDLPSGTVAIRPRSGELRAVTTADTGVTSVPTHGLGVAGILAAVGDNGTDMPGIIWDSELKLYAFATGQSIVINPVTWFIEILDSARTHQVQVLNVSGSMGEVSDTGTVGILREALRRYLDSGPDRLIVQAVGDDTLAMTVAGLSVTTNSHLRAMDRAMAQLFLLPGYRGKILFVAGTSAATGQKTTSSNLWTDGEQVGAPADLVVSLTATSGSAIGYHGTSFAAPFVSGVAALLWKMNPGLPADSIKDFVLRGAQALRIDSTTGLSSTPSNIGVPGVYQLDAYGSLSLLSRERQHLPACGFPVAIHGTLTSQPWVVFTRNGANADSFQLTGFNPDLKFSIAQGGRRLAAPSMDSAGQFVTQEFARSGSSWTQVNSVPGVRSRTYLEEDTVDALQDERTWVLRGSRWGSSGTTINLPALVHPSDPNTGVGFVRFSPEGSFAVVRGSGAPCPNQFARDEAFLVAIPSGTVTPLLNLQCSAGDNERYAMDATWHPDANRFVLAERNDALIQSILYPRKVSGSGVAPDGVDVLIADRLIIDYGSGHDAHLSDPSGAVAVWKEYTLNGVGGCHLTSRTFRGGVFVSQVSLPFSDPIWGLNCLVPVPTLRQTSGIRPVATRRAP